MCVKTATLGRFREFFVFEQGNQFFQRPHMIGKTRFHRRSNPQGLMDAAEIVVGVVDRNHVAVVLEFLRRHL